MALIAFTVIAGLKSVSTDICIIYSAIVSTVTSSASSEAVRRFSGLALRTDKPGRRALPSGRFFSLLHRSLQHFGAKAVCGGACIP